MRKLLVPGVLLSVLIACETKTPVEPNVTPTTAPTTTTVAPTPGQTTSVSTTTTAVLGSLARNYKAFPAPPPNVPSEMTLFFELISAAAISEQARAGQPLIGVTALTENEYKVTGVFVMANGTTGTVDGELDGASNPLETGGEFEGSLTANTPSGCTASRDFSGAITPSTLQLAGGTPGATQNCTSNPLMSFSNISMLRSDPGAPLPTPPPSTTSSTTTSVACSYSLNPTSDRVSSAGGARTVNINTQTGCTWSAQSFADWITVRPPQGGGGSATVTYDVQPSSTARVGNLLIAGIQFPVTQDAPFVDLVAAPPNNQSCSVTGSGGSETWSVTVPVNNSGTGTAGASTTRAFVPGNGECIPDRNIDRPTGPVAPGGSTPVIFELPEDCFRNNETNEICRFTITADFGNSVAESSEANNSADGSCTRPFPEGLAGRRGSK